MCQRAKCDRISKKKKKPFVLPPKVAGQRDEQHCCEGSHHSTEPNPQLHTLTGQGFLFRQGHPSHAQLWLSPHVQNVLRVNVTEQKRISSRAFLNDRRSEKKLIFKKTCTFFRDFPALTAFVCSNTPDFLLCRRLLSDGSLSRCRWDRPRSSPTKNRKCSHHRFLLDTDCNDKSRPSTSIYLKQGQAAPGLKDRCPAWFPTSLLLKLLSG